jgi:nucleotide-binding universal stress UspA family protein
MVTCALPIGKCRRSLRELRLQLPEPQDVLTNAVKPPFLTLTVPIDPSYDVNRAIGDAITLAGGVTMLHFCSVVDAAVMTASGATGAIISLTQSIEALEARAATACEEAVAKAIEHGLAADGEVLLGSTAAMIADVARRNGGEAILVHTHGRRGISLLIAGSVAEDLLALTPVPLVVIHNGDRLAGEGPYTVAVDGSSAANAALELAIGLAARRERALHIVYAATRGEDPSLAASILEPAAKRARAAGVPVEMQVLQGAAARAIADGARRNSSVLIMMGTHGRSGIARAALGSVAAAVIQHARLPVMVVRGVR